MTDTPLRQRTSSDVVGWRRDGVVLGRQRADSDFVDELMAAAEPILCDRPDVGGGGRIDVTGRPQSLWSATSTMSSVASVTRAMASLAETARRLTGEVAEVTAMRFVEVGSQAVGVPARQLVHEVRVPELLASCAILLNPDPTTCVVEIAAGRHHDVLISNEEGLLPASAERALTWRPLELSVGFPVWIHPLAPVRAPRTVRGAGALDAKLVLLHLTRTVPPVVHREVVATSFAPPASITSSAPATASAVADAIVQLYETRGALPYLDGVDHASHALQAGAHAMAAGASVSMIVAAFLHDIGILIGDDARAFRGSAGGGTAGIAVGGGVWVDHGIRGGRLLERWFTSDVTRPIRLHVAAQRYLAAARSELDEPSFGAAARRRGPEPVGEPMSPAEMRAFEATDGWLDALRLRRWDAAAVEPGAPTPSLDTFRILIESVAVAERALR